MSWGAVKVQRPPFLRTKSWSSISGVPGLDRTLVHVRNELD
ncbi:hypothetical protein AZE42_12944 [Rhizopogon vesiculosus]|uniref:Uncharacterized protein n=1 Tax=Rhizopogon vesiculosus TaxID=180088 RepID=A0A1J8R1S3_9AGAM|nr:hypothetical protein AZE42_12944 [Rhizopogon vesiculosus]